MDFSSRETYFGFEELALTIQEFKNEDLTFIFDEEYAMNFKVKKTYKTNNGLAKYHEAYDEYNVIELKPSDKSLGLRNFPLSYHIMPLQVRLGYNVVFDINEFLASRDKQNDDLPIVKLISSDHGLIEGSYGEEGEFVTGSILDDDPELISINKEYIALMNEIILKAGTDADLDEKVVTNNLLLLSTRFKNRVNDLNDGSFTVEDYLEDYSADGKNFHDGKFNFRKCDLAAIDQGNSNNLLKIGSEFYTKEEYEGSFPFYFASALMGNPQAISNLGYSFMYGRGVEANFELALVCFKIAANLSSDDACYKLATIYRYNEKYKDLNLARRYFLLAVKNLKGHSLSTNPSLAYNLAKEKLENGLFKLDEVGAYYLLLLAHDGYQMSLKEGFKPYQKQFDEVNLLLQDKKFDSIKLKYKEDLKYSYKFSIDPFVNDELSNPDSFKVGDEVYTCIDYGEKINLPAGTLGVVKKVLDGELVVKFPNFEQPIFYTFNDVIKKVS